MADPNPAPSSSDELVAPTPLPSDVDVLVIGAGPAGSAAAAVLAEAGHCVLVAEKSDGPRYKIGESLLPYCWYPLTRLGVVDRVRGSAFVVDKNSVQFVSTSGQRSKPYYFFQHRDHPSSRTWQVVRKEFDGMLIENAREKGARVEFATRARRLLREGGRVVGVAVERDGEEHEVRARMTIDASGRDTFAQTENGWRVPDPELRKIAIWSYYEGAKRDPGLDAGATTVAYLPTKGWIWYIPLVGDRVSVGVVGDAAYLYRKGRDKEAIYERECRGQPWIREHLEGARRVSECQVTSDFSYRSRHCGEDGLVLAGDAFSFVDPVFSSGVMLALWSGVMVADAVDASLRADDVSAHRFQAYSDEFRRGIEAMRRLVYAFYDPDFRFSTFLTDHPKLRADLTDCLIGNMDRGYDDLFAVAARYASIPAPVPHGGPRVTPRDVV